MKITSDIDAAEGEDYRININLPDINYDLSKYLIQKNDGIIFFYKSPFMHTERQTPLDALCLDDVLKGSFPGYRLISRLDFGVDGIIAALREDIETQYEQKIYYAWVEGDFPDECSGRWVIDANKKRKVIVQKSDQGGKMDFRCLKRSNGHSLVEITLSSAGRHQVRAVCAYLGYPIAGDFLYGNAEEETENKPQTKPPQRIGLHCYKVTVNGVSAVSPYKDAFEIFF